VRGRLAENTVPACLIWGTKERRFRPLAEHAIEHMPNLERVELDAGHGMNMECPEEFNKAVLEFISRWHTS
jgi:pimeloyl-ACP methyl ester carboxylesterase